MPHASSLVASHTLGALAWPVAAGCPLGLASRHCRVGSDDRGWHEPPISGGVCHKSYTVVMTVLGRLAAEGET